jgi:ribonuclease HI
MRNPNAWNTHGRGNPIKPDTAGRFLTVNSGGEFQIFVDGCCEPNPGAAGWAFTVQKNGQEIASEFGGFDHATNNIAELTALLKGLQWTAAKLPDEQVVLFSDPQYSVRGATEWLPGWKAKNWRRGGDKAKEKNQKLANVDIWQAIDRAISRAPNVSIRWCKGHAGIPGNERADELAEIGRLSVGDRNETATDYLTSEYRDILAEVA